MKRCENCYWYRWEDSVWGYCWKKPPQYLLKKIFPKIQYDLTRPEVFYDTIVCGEFKERKLKYFKVPKNYFKKLKLKIKVPKK